jgi:hypothetical protein
VGGRGGARAGRGKVCQGRRGPPPRACPSADTPRPTACETFREETVFHVDITRAWHVRVLARPLFPRRTLRCVLRQPRVERANSFGETARQRSCGAGLPSPPTPEKDRQCPEDKCNGKRGVRPCPPRYPLPNERKGPRKERPRCELLPARLGLREPCHFISQGAEFSNKGPLLVSVKPFQFTGRLNVLMQESLGV